MIKLENRNVVGVTVFAILMGLAAVSLAGWLFTSKPADIESHDRISDPVGSLSSEHTGLEKTPSGTAESENETLRAELSEEAKRRIELAQENARLAEQLAAAEEENRNLGLRVGTIRDSRDRLRGQIESAKASEGKAMSGLRAQLETSRLAGEKIEAKLKKQDGEFAALKSRIEELQKQIEASRVTEQSLREDLKKHGGDLVSAKQQYANLQKQFDAQKNSASARENQLQKQIDDARKTEQAMRQSLKANESDLASAKQKSADLQKQVEALRKSAAGAKGRMKNDDEARKAARAMRDKLKKLEGDLASAKKGATALQTTNGNLQRELDALRAENAKLVAASKEMRKPAPAAPSVNLTPAVEGTGALDLPLLVNDPNKLAPNLRGLFGQLRKIEDNPGAREKAYADISKDGKYNARLRIPFKTGSDWVSRDAVEKLRAAATEAGEGASILVVGYASTDGSARTNSALSSQRASNVASKLAELRGGKKNIQAVYFGQTSRFSSRMTPNRIVEVWIAK